MVGLLGLPVLCGGLILLSAVSNIGLPQQSAVVDRLGALEKAQLAEAIQLRGAVGNAVWPGWGDAAIPVLLWNEQYAFLVGHPAPPPGWEAVPDDDFFGAPYYRQVARDPQAFAVRVGDVWAASMATREWMPLALHAEVRNDLPEFLKPLFPYRLVTRVYTTDWHIAAIQHESFHAYQAQTALERLRAAENTVRSGEARYLWDHAEFQADWAAELKLLQQAVQAASDAEATDLARQFLAGRTLRRQSVELSPDMGNYERQREWLEGTAKYVELQAWRAGATTPAYTPQPALTADRQFKDYRGYQQRLNEEIRHLTRLKLDQPGDSRFYYSGMAQALLLDRLAPGWKDRAFDDGVWLEALLAEAVN
jgi:hypothetical protein